jgi:hypothetical protein
MAIQKEIWQDHIEGNLFKNNEFLLASTDAGQFVLQGKVVHIPQAGTQPAISKNRSTLPATVLQRADSDITYSLDEYTSDPILIPHAETLELSYNKRESVLSEHEASLRQTIADNILVAWAPAIATSLVRTSGDAVLAHLDSATGNRKKFVVADLKAAQLKLNKQNVPMEGRYALLSADMFQQLTDSLSVNEYRDFSAAYNIKDGVLGRIFGFNIMMRSAVVSYTNDTTPAVKAYGATAATDDNDAVLCWQADCLERAVGAVKFFERADDPTYYGSIYSMSVRMGGRKRRADSKGVIAIVQSAAA